MQRTATCALTWDCSSLSLPVQAQGGAGRAPSALAVNILFVPVFDDKDENEDNNVLSVMAETGKGGGEAEQHVRQRTLSPEITFATTRLEDSMPVTRDGA